MTDFGKAKMADANFPIALYKEGQSKSSIVVSDVMFENGEQIVVIFQMKQNDIFLNLCGSCISRTFDIN